MNQELLQAGKIVNTHALRGDIRIYPYCDSAEFLCDVPTLYIDNTPYKVTSARVHKGQALLHLKGIDSIDAAEAVVGKLVYFNKNDIDLEDGQFFVDDIVGSTVIDVDTNAIYGKVTAVFPTGANDVFEVTGERVLLVPKIDEVVLEINTEEKIIKIRPLKGLFE
ncbi:MAG: 16S rRNA processing protein RimM [Clostridia bacterium]|nr:16S rRNA processing protein RimM [Clostridia bacterium]